jgi:hypothetical protein
MTKWRAGTKAMRTIYRDDVLVGIMDTPELAAQVVNALTSECQASGLVEEIEQLKALLRIVDHAKFQQAERITELETALAALWEIAEQHDIKIMRGTNEYPGGVCLEVFDGKHRIEYEATTLMAAIDKARAALKKPVEPV